MGAFLEGAGAAVEAGTGAFAAGQSAHENAVQYRQDAQTGADARRQNERLMNGPAPFPEYGQNVQGYTTPGYEMYGSTPAFTDGAPQQGGNLPPDTQLSAQPVGHGAVLSPDGQSVSYPGAVQGIANAVMPQQGFDVGSAIGGQPVYMQQQASPFLSLMPGVGPVWFTDGAPATNAVQSGMFGQRR